MTQRCQEPPASVARFSRYFSNSVMSFSVKSPRVDALLAEVRALTGEDITEAIQHALEERLERLQSPGRIERVD